LKATLTETFILYDSIIRCKTKRIILLKCEVKLQEDNNLSDELLAKKLGLNKEQTLQILFGCSSEIRLLHLSIAFTFGNNTNENIFTNYIMEDIFTNYMKNMPTSYTKNTFTSHIDNIFMSYIDNIFTSNIDNTFTSHIDNTFMSHIDNIFTNHIDNTFVNEVMQIDKEINRFAKNDYIESDFDVAIQSITNSINMGKDEAIQNINMNENEAIQNINMNEDSCWDTIDRDSIQWLPNANEFLVPSKSNLGVVYNINSDIGTCSYSIGMTGVLCKHQGAIAMNEFEENEIETNNVDNSSFDKFLEEISDDYKNCGPQLRKAFEIFAKRYRASKSQSIAQAITFLYNPDSSIQIKSGAAIRV
ncbi:11589_t:CDS:2, partial [Dentiscutata erythropus]